MTLPINPDGTTVFGEQKINTSACLNVSIVTRVRNRRHHLLQSIPTWLQFPVGEIIIVDWDSDLSLQNLPAAFDDSRIKVVRVTGKSGFDRSAAWNAGIAAASAEWVFLLDADVKVLASPFTDRIFSLPSYDNYYRIYSDRYAPFFYGSSIILKEQWEAVGGFNENMTGWGWEDTDFYGRMTDKYNEVTLPLGYFESITHTDEERKAEHAEKDLRISAARNAYLARCVSQISIHPKTSATIYGKSEATLVSHYHQHITYSRDYGIIQSMIHSQDFARIVKTYNLFDGADTLRRLFDIPEFKALEASYFPQPKIKKCRKR